MSAIASPVGAFALLLVWSLAVAAPDQSPTPTTKGIEPYPGSVSGCSDHIIGAPQPGGKAGSHISWTGYYSTDPVERVVAHYQARLGVENYKKEGDDHVWRFPLDKPNTVLSVTAASGKYPWGTCRRPPASARAVMIISSIARPD